jgi:uncharacterized membrane protein
MENKYVGLILLGVAVLVIVNIFVFNSMVKSSGENFCTADDCSYHSSFNNLIYLSYAIAGILAIVGFVLIFSKPQIQTIIKTRTVEKKKEKKLLNIEDLNNEEKIVLGLIRENRAIFQAELIEKTNFGKAKMTRILDRLEGKGFVERKRRGMTNVVVYLD